MKHRQIKKRESKYTGDTKRKLSIWPVGVQKGETEVNWGRDIFDEILTENFPKLLKSIKKQ